MQDTSHYHIYFLRVSSGATYYEKGITCRTHFNRYHGNVLQSNNDSTKKISLTLIVYKANNICSFMLYTYEMIEYFIP